MSATNIIFGLSGPRLTDAEIACLKDVQPWGFILFARNIETRDQVLALTNSLKDLLGRDSLPILIDQEGGRVSRMKAPEWRTPPAPPVLARLFKHDPATAVRAFYLNYRLIAHDLRAVGVTVNCVPMLDLPSPDAAEIVTERALGETPDQVIALGRATADGSRDGGVAPIIKHAPGHGRAVVDSHLSMPTISEDLETLKAWDFKPFAALRHELTLMTAHIVFDALDPVRPATISSTVIQKILRGEIGFDGLILSDDLNMQALSGSVADRTAACLAAGCDIALQCSGDLADMESAAKAVAPLAGEALRRTAAVEALIAGQPPDFDAGAARAELNDLLARSAALSPSQ